MQFLHAQDAPFLGTAAPEPLTRFGRSSFRASDLGLKVQP